MLPLPPMFWFALGDDGDDDGDGTFLGNFFNGDFGGNPVVRIWIADGGDDGEDEFHTGVFKGEAEAFDMRDLEEEPLLRNSFAEFFTGVFKEELYMLTLFLRDDFCGDDEEELRLAITRA